MDRWYSADELRQSWFLLCIETTRTESGAYISSCEIGDGNADQLIATETFTAGSLQEEAQLLQTIGTELDERRYSGISLTTPTRDTLAILRTRLLGCDEIAQPTLRGFSHLIIDELLEKYFDSDRLGPESYLIKCRNDGQTPSELRTSGLEDASVSTLWNVRTAIGPLVPPEALRGTSL